jgi:hypothetical protein
MTTIRRGALPSDNFTIISNAWLRDSTLSWAARGLLAWMASHTDGFEITEDVIVESGPTGRDGVRTMIYTLEEAGYLRRVREPVVTGGSTVDFVLTDPRAAENPPLGSGGKSDPRPDQAEQGVSAGEANGGKSPPRSSVEDQEKTKKTSSSTRVPRSTAMRVPEDFEPDEKMRAWYSAEQLEQVISGRIEHQKFMNYWIAQPGAKGRKLDWRRTWMNWMLNAAERAGRRPGNALVPTSGAPYRPSTTDQRVGQALDLARKYEEQGL